MHSFLQLPLFNSPRRRAFNLDPLTDGPPLRRNVHLQLYASTPEAQIQHLLDVEKTGEV
jgi:hypothetical protein